MIHLFASFLLSHMARSKSKTSLKKTQSPANAVSQIAMTTTSAMEKMNKLAIRFSSSGGSTGGVWNHFKLIASNPQQGTNTFDSWITLPANNPKKCCPRDASKPCGILSGHPRFAKVGKDSFCVFHATNSLFYDTKCQALVFKKRVSFLRLCANMLIL